MNFVLGMAILCCAWAAAPSVANSCPTSSIDEKYLLTHLWTHTDSPLFSSEESLWASTGRHFLEHNFTALRVCGEEEEEGLGE